MYMYIYMYIHTYIYIYIYTWWPPGLFFEALGRRTNGGHRADAIWAAKVSSAQSRYSLFPPFRGRLADAESGPPNQSGERAAARRTRVAIAITVRPYGGRLVHPGASSPICPLSTI